MPSSPSPSTLEALRARVARIETGAGARGRILPFGLAPLDAALPGGGLARGALHEIAGGPGEADDAAAALFAAGLLARAEGPALWCVARADLFAPALAQAGLRPDRVIHVEAGDEASLLACFEEGLRHGALGGVAAEISRLSLTASRRLQLAAERSGAIGLALRRGSRAEAGRATAAPSAAPTAATTRWRVSSLPSAPLPVPGVGRARWRVELLRCRGGAGGVEFVVEACDETGRLALPAELADRPAAAAPGTRRASA